MTKRAALTLFLSLTAFAHADAPPLAKEQAAALSAELLSARQQLLRDTYDKQLADNALTLNGKTLKLLTKEYGTKPDKGHALFLSMHGGGNTAPTVNDQQWQNQIRLYKADEALFIAPRAPTNTWNLWHESHIDDLFDTLLQALVAQGTVDPDRVYLLGYSAGGDGVYQLAPRLADRLAAASMMAGHPNDASPLALRNLPFAIHVGALDAGFNRNKVALEWKDKLDALHAADPQGYTHLVELHKDRPHWMNGEDQSAIPWMLHYTRNPLPQKVVWKQSSSRLHTRFYWLAVPEGVQKKNSLVTVSRNGQTFTIEAAENVPQLVLRLNDDMLDLDQPVTVLYQNKPLFQGKLPRTRATLEKTITERADPRALFPAELLVQLPQPTTTPATQSSDKLRRRDYSTD